MSEKIKEFETRFRSLLEKLEKAGSDDRAQRAVLAEADREVEVMLGQVEDVEDEIYIRRSAEIFGMTKAALEEQ